MKAWWITRAVKILIALAVGALALGLVVMLLWNALIPDLFKGPELSFWQAVGLLALVHILLRGLGRWHHSSSWHRDRWRKKFEFKLASMAPEDREKFREEWRTRCGHHWHEEPPPASEPRQ